MPPMTGPPNRGERMCSCTRMRTRASARASSLCRTCRFISSPSKSALYGGHTARLKRNVLWGMTRTSCAIMDIRCREGCRLNSTMSPSTSCRSTVYPTSTASATTSAFFSVTRIRRPSGPVPRRRDARRLVVEVRRHVILEQLPKVLDDQLGRTRVPVLAQTLVDPQDVDELVREVVLRAVAALEGDRRTHGDGRDEQRGQDHPLGPGDLGVHPEDPEVFVRDPLEALAHLFRCELLTVLAERRRLVEGDLSLFLAAMGTALPLLRFAGGLLRDEANLRHVAAELLDLFHLRHVLLRLLAREEQSSALPARRLEELLDVLHVPDVDHRHREIDVTEVTRAIVDLPAARLAPETGLDDPEMGIHQAHVDRESIVVVRVRRDDLRRRHPADLIGAQESELDRLDPLRDPPH